MNFLAHAYLSKGEADLLVGNFIADFVKGSQILSFPDGIQEGIRLHRRIDAFTDSHPLFICSKRRLAPKYRHYSGVIVDLIYDHLLAKNWNDFHSDSLLSFTEKLYETVQSEREILPAEVRRLLQYMAPDNWLFHYRSLAGVDRALNGLARRARFDSKMDEAIIDLKLHYQYFEQDFRAFLPEVERDVTCFLNY